MEFLYDPEQARLLTDVVLGQITTSVIVPAGWHNVVDRVARVAQRLVQSASGLKVVYERLGRCERWEGYSTRHYRQTSREHCVTLALLAGRLFPDLVERALVHDVGEGITGDVTYRFKQHPLMRYVYPAVEAEETESLLVSLGEEGKRLWRVYRGDGGSEDWAFQALECLDYVLYATQEVFVHRNHCFVTVFSRQWPRLEQFFLEFPRLREIIAPWIDSIRCAIDSMPPSVAAHARIDRSSKKHVSTLLNAAQRLLQEME